MSAEQELKARADAVLSGAIAAGAAPGAVAIAADHEGVIYEGAAGVRSLGGADAMDPDTVCWLASMTKPFTSVAAVQLIERGLLELDAPASVVLAELGEIGVLTGFGAGGSPQVRPPKRPITLRHLLTHTSGFGYDLYSADIVKAQAALGLPGLAEGKLTALNAPLLFDPGNRWEYGVSTDWVGRMVEAVAGKTLGAYLKEHVFDPLGMSSTAFFLTPELRERLAGMHMRTPDGALAPFPLEAPQAPEFESGGGGLYSTARAYVRFVRMILGGGALDDVRILGPGGMTLVSTNQMGDVRVAPLKSVTPLSLDLDLFPGIPAAWSLAFSINLKPLATGRAAGGLMWAGLSNCYFWIDPSARLGGVLLTQLLPFGDPGPLRLWMDFESAVARR